MDLEGLDRKKLEAMKLLIELMKANNLPPVTSPSRCIDAILTAIETRFRQMTRILRCLF